MIEKFALSKLQVIGRNSVWFMALFAPVMIGRTNYFVLVFRQSFEKRSIINVQTINTWLNAPNDAWNFLKFLVACTTCCILLLSFL